MMQPYRTTSRVNSDKMIGRWYDENHRHCERRTGWHPLEKIVFGLLWMAMVTVSTGWFYLDRKIQTTKNVTLKQYETDTKNVRASKAHRRMIELEDDESIYAVGGALRPSKECEYNWEYIHQVCQQHQQDVTCQEHTPEHNNIMLHNQDKDSTATDSTTKRLLETAAVADSIMAATAGDLVGTTSLSGIESTCKTLWFAGFHEGKNSRCNNEDGSGGGGYRSDYARALASAIEYADETIQPVLLLGRYGLDASEDVSSLRSWAAANGAIVLLVDQLSFQNDVSTSWLNEEEDLGHQMGPFLMMEIPKLIEEHQLFNIPNICSENVLYTDSDIMFVNKITHNDIASLKYALTTTGKTTNKNTTTEGTVQEEDDDDDTTPFLLYGREQLINIDHPYNTGVMYINVNRFEQEIPHMIEYRNKHNDNFPKHSYAQQWFQQYYNQDDKKHYVAMLPLYWNWKSSWNLEPRSSFNDLKIVHFHGPKPASGLYKIAFCEVDLTFFWPIDYHNIILSGICCDQGKTAYKIYNMIQQLSPRSDEICYDVTQSILLPKKSKTTTK